MPHLNRHRYRCWAFTEEGNQYPVDNPRSGMVPKDTRDILFIEEAGKLPTVGFEWEEGNRIIFHRLYDMEYLADGAHVPEHPELSEVKGKHKRLFQFVGYRDKEVSTVARIDVDTGIVEIKGYLNGD